MAEVKELLYDRLLSREIERGGYEELKDRDHFSDYDKGSTGGSILRLTEEIEFLRNLLDLIERS